MRRTDITAAKESNANVYSSGFYFLHNNSLVFREDKFMGSWGTGLYQDDIACDVRDYYIDCLREDDESAENKTLEYFEEEICDDEDGPVVWFALADTQWKYGRLSEMVKNRALEYIDNGINLQLWNEVDNKLYAKREKVLSDLKDELLSPVPPKKKLRKPHVFTCSWNIGDVFAYQLKSDTAREKGVFGKWLVMQKVNQADNLKNGLSPVVTVRLIDSDVCPDMNALKEPCIRIDRYMGYKWSYRLHLLVYSKKSLSNFVFIGNSSLALAADDYPHENNKGYFMSMLKFFDENVLEALKEYGTDNQIK